MKKNAVFSLLALLFLWLVWVIAYLCVGNAYVLPSAGETFSRVWELLQSGSFWRAFFHSLLRTAEAFAVSAVAGVALAAASRLWGGVRAFLAPLVSVLRTMPTMAIILMLLLWTSPAAAPVIVAVLVLMPAVYAAALAAFDEAAQRYGELARAYHVGAGRRIFCMYLPLCAPNLLRQSGAIFSMGLKITVSSEVLANTYRSLGGLMQEAKMYLEMPTLMALTLLTVVAGFLLEGICALAYRLIVRWKP